MKRIPELDGIRGVAIVMVLVFHYFVQPMQFQPGSALAYLQAACRLSWSGVDLFFVLSGFLIGGILLDSRDRPDYFRSFYTRRFFRIVPIYAATLMLTHPLMGWIGMHQVGRWWVYPLFLQNFSMAAANDFGLWAVTWSLAVEEQFYLTLPAIVRYVRSMLPWIIGGGIVAAPIIRVVLFYIWPDKIFRYLLMPCRADALLLGVVAAMWMRNASAAEWLRHHTNYLWAAGCIFLVGAGVITLHVRGISGIEMPIFSLTWLALLYTTVLLLAVTQPQSWLGAVLRFGPLRSLGRIAYGVYLLHYLLLVALKTNIRSWPYVVVAALALTATLMLSALSWHYFEKPLIDYGHRRSSSETRKVMSLARPTSNAVASGQGRPRWTHVLPAPVRSLCRPLLHEWRHFYGVSKEKLREKVSAPSVTSYLTGGCANQIFQYATGLALARRLGVDHKLDVSSYETATPSQPRMYSLGLFKGVDAPLVHSLLGQIIREEGFPYKPELFENAPRKCSLVGYWQCEKYFFGLRDELRERLLPRKPLPARSIATERAILDAGERAVFVTVRRTDYVGNPYHVVLPMDYYREAAALVAAKVPNPVFFIFSDDPEWCEANFKLPYHTTIAGNFDRTVENHLGREDAELYLMRLCDHAIMANSSYSWWGAWLGADIKGGVVIAPKIWVGPASKDDPRDIVPSRWIRL